MFDRVDPHRIAKPTLSTAPNSRSGSRMNYTNVTNNSPVKTKVSDMETPVHFFRKIKFTHKYCFELGRLIKINYKYNFLDFLARFPLINQRHQASFY